MTDDESDDDEITACKRAERAWLEPEEWTREGLAARWAALRAELLDATTTTVIRREEAGQLTRSRFVEDYEQASVPCIVTGHDGGWERHTVASLVGEFGGLNWRVSDTHGEMVGLAEWADYAASTEDDAPFGIYDSEFGDEGSPTARLAATYETPAFVSEDAFARVEGERPPWRWVLIGCERSGTGMHVDPLLTHAWVHLCEGRKRWLMLPPSTPAAALAAVGVAEGEPQTPSSLFFAKHRAVIARDVPGAVEFVQRAGELVYVPAGWTHAVVNLEATVALTHNYATLTPECVAATARDEPDFFIRLLARYPPGEAAAVDAYRAARPHVLNDVPVVAACVCAFAATETCVAAAPTCRAFVGALDVQFWTDRLRRDFGDAAFRSAATRGKHSLAAWRRAYLDMQEADEYERAETYAGLC